MLAELTYVVRGGEEKKRRVTHELNVLKDEIFANLNGKTRVLTVSRLGFLKIEVHELRRVEHGYFNRSTTIFYPADIDSFTYMIHPLLFYPSPEETSKVHDTVFFRIGNDTLSFELSSLPQLWFPVALRVEFPDGERMRLIRKRFKF